MATIQKRNDRDKPWRVRWREGAIHRSRSFRLKSEAKAFDRRGRAHRGRAASRDVGRPAGSAQ
jgi:hypothetical protein